MIYLNKLATKRVFLVQNGKVALVSASMIVTYYIKLFRAGADRLLLVVAETFILVFILNLGINIKVVFLLFTR